MMGHWQNRRHVSSVTTVDQLVPTDHFLRTVDEMIDFSFIEDLSLPHYSEAMGRPSIPPPVLFRMLFLGYFYGIRSERQLEKEIQTNVAYRWFLGLSLEDPVPDHSTISVNRRRRFGDTDVFREIFERTVEMAQEDRMVGGRVLLTDSTHIKANANKNRFMRQAKPVKAAAYLEELEAEVADERKNQGKKPSLNERRRGRPTNPRG
jgi:transposase